MKRLLLAAALALVPVSPAHAGDWSPASLPAAAPVVLAVLGFLVIAGALRGRKL